MDILEALKALAEKIKQQGNLIKTEEATKNAFIMPFLSNVLGYDVFDATEVIPEFVCDIGTKKGEKIDYAIFHSNTVQILIECKKFGESLKSEHASQLFRYFHVTSARIAILTDGQFYQFFTDIDEKNKMDSKPFLVLDILNVDEHQIPEITKITKNSFNLESIINAAEELKYVGQLKKELSSEISNPSDDFVKFFTSRVWEKTITQKVRDQFSSLLKKAIVQFMNDQINERLKSAIAKPAEITSDALISQELEESYNKEDTIEPPTEMEIEAFYTVKSIIRMFIPSERIFYRDSQTYFSIIADDNNRKTICRIYFNKQKKFIGIFDEQKNEIKYNVENVDDIYNYSEKLKTIAEFYSKV